LVIVKDKEWYNCSAGDVSCLRDDLLPVYTIKNDFPSPMLIGDYYLKVYDPIPWAWASAFKEKNKMMPCKILKISIKK